MAARKWTGGSRQAISKGLLLLLDRLIAREPGSRSPRVSFVDSSPCRGLGPPIGSGRLEEARSSAFSALHLGRRLGLVRSILDVNAQIVPLIRKLSKAEPLDPLLAFYVDRLAAASTPATLRIDTTQTAPSEPLSEREFEIVDLLAQALPNKKIARTLGLSPETVKWHLKNIYGKLGVSGRDEAVARMRDARSPDDRAQSGCRGAALKTVTSSELSGNKIAHHLAGAAVDAVDP